LLRHSYRRDKLSVIGGLTVSPEGKRFGLYVRFHAQNITGTEVMAFLRYLLRHLRGHVVVVWDGGRIHKRKDVKAFLRGIGRLHVFPFPAYAPELNPIEYVWTHGKRDLSNSAHLDTRTLGRHLGRSFRRVRHSHRLLSSCIEHSELRWP
jgi:transposase